MIQFKFPFPLRADNLTVNIKTAAVTVAPLNAAPPSPGCVGGFGETGRAERPDYSKQEMKNKK